MEDRMLGGFYAGANGLGTIGNTLKTYDELGEIVARMQEEVARTGNKRYIVQVVAVVEPQPPAPPPTKVTVIDSLIERTGGWKK